MQFPGEWCTYGHLSSMVVHVKKNHPHKNAHPLEVHMWVYYLIHQSWISYLPLLSYETLGMGIFYIATDNHDIVPSLPVYGLTSNPI